MEWKKLPDAPGWWLRCEDEEITCHDVLEYAEEKSKNIKLGIYIPIVFEIVPIEKFSKPFIEWAQITLP